MIQPHASEIEGLEYTYSSSDEKVLLGLSVFLAVWRSGGKLYLVQVVLPGERSKHELFQELLKQLKAVGCEPKAVYFDSWYAASATLNLIDQLQWTYVTRIKSNRLFQGAQLKTHKFFGATVRGQEGGLKAGHDLVMLQHVEMVV